MVEPAILFDGILSELETAVRAMQRAKSAEQKLHQSQIIRNLTESMASIGSLMEAMTPGTMESYDDEEEDEDEDDEYNPPFGRSPFN